MNKETIKIKKTLQNQQGKRQVFISWMPHKNGKPCLLIQTFRPPATWHYIIGQAITNSSTGDIIITEQKGNILQLKLVPC